MRIGFINTQGLPPEKASALTTHQLHSHFDVIMIAESWFADIHHPNNYYIQNQKNICYNSKIGNQYFLCHSLLPKPTPNRQRLGGGLSIYLTDSARQKINSFSASEHYIIVKFRTFSAAVVYFPPSLAPNDIETQLKLIGHCDIIFGDINVRFGERFADDNKKATTGDRRTVFSNLLHSGFKHLVPELKGGLTRVDHVYSKIPVQYVVINPPVVTDHPGMLSITVGANETLNQTRQSRAQELIDSWTNKEGQRFHLKILSQNDTAPRLVAEYAQECARMHLQTELDKAQISVDRLDNSAKQLMIDYIDFIICSAVSYSARIILGAYTVNVARQQNEDLAETLGNLESHEAVVKQFKRACRPAAPLLQSSTPGLTVKEDVERHYNEIFKQPERDFRAGTEFLQEIDFIGTASLADTMCTDNVKIAVKTYPTTKAPGNDNLHVKILHALMDSQLVVHLSRLFQLCCATGRTPKRWNTSTVYPMPKKPHTVSIADCRPIALTVMFRRIFENLLYNHLMSAADCFQLRSFHPSQGGFRHGHSTSIHSGFLHDISNIAGPSLIRVFVDFKQAYDRVPTRLMLQKLMQRTCPPYIVSLISSLFVGCSAKIAVNSRLTNSITMERGLFQGSRLSPFLFNVFIDDLAWEICPNPRLELNCLLFADDLVLLHYDIGPMQTLCDSVTNWSWLNGMTVNISKCGTLGSDFPFEMSNQPIVTVQTYKYLGFPHRWNGIDFVEFADHIISKSRALWQAHFDHSLQWPEWVRLMIYKSYLRSMFEYGAPLVLAFCERHNENSIGASLLDKFKSLHQELVKWLIPFSTSKQITQFVLGLPDIETRFTGLIVSFRQHLTGMAADNPARVWIQNDARSSGINNRRLLLNYCIRHPAHQEVAGILNDAPAGQEMEFQTAIKKWTLQRICSHSDAGFRQSILPSARSNGYGACLSIRSSNTFVRKYALQWRVGSFGRAAGDQARCASAHEFNRACPIRCYTIYQADEEHKRKNRITYRHYCIFDQLLNEKKYAEFLTKMEQFRDNLRMPDNARNPRDVP